jgi:hypothetical protein
VTKVTDVTNVTTLPLTAARIEGDVMTSSKTRSGSAAAVGAIALLVAGAGAAMAEMDDPHDFPANGSPGQLEIHLTEEHGYTDVQCDKEVPVNEPEYTIDAEVYPNPVALRIQGNGGNRIVLDPLTGTPYGYPEGSNSKINFVIVCTGEGTADPGDPGDPNPPIETDGPAQKPAPNAGLIGGLAALAGGTALLAAGVRRRTDEK